MSVDSTGNFRFQRRTATGRTAKSDDGGSGNFPETGCDWCEAENDNRLQICQRCEWTKVRSENFAMAYTIYIGVAVASGSSDASNTTLFDNMVVVP